MNKITLTLALVAATIAVTCAQLSAEIHIEAVGLPTVRLTACPQVKPLQCTTFHQYKLIGHYSNLKLGDAKPGSASSAPRLWNRLFVSSTGKIRPLDIFKSSSKANAETGHQVISCSAAELAKRENRPVLNVQGTTTNPSGNIVLCVDFIPAPPKPSGKLNLSRLAIRDGQKISIGWQRQR